MTSAPSALDPEAIKAGLLMESAHSQQRLAETQLDRLRAHTDGLDAVVRDEIRRTLVEEFRALEHEGRRASAALLRLQRVAGLRWTASAAALATVLALLPAVIERWTAPGNAQLEQLRERRDALAANIKQLERAGAGVEWHRCGDSGRLCVRVDPKAPVYGPAADYYVVKEH